jgi:sorting nexin-8
MMGIERSRETHPFFQSRPIPHRVVKVQEIGDNVSNTRKRKSGPLVERPSNAHLPQSTTDNLRFETKSPTSLASECSMARSPEKKLLKLNANGKLLSSPPLASVDLASAEESSAVSPRMKSAGKKGRPPKSRSSSLIAKIGYGRKGYDERLRVGSTINDLLVLPQKVSISQNPSNPQKKRTPKKSTHPFFVGKVRTALVEKDDVRPENGSGEDSAGSVSPTRAACKRESPQAKKSTACKDIVFLPTRKQDCRQEALPAPWPSKDIQRVDDLPHELNLPLQKMTAPFPGYKSKGRTMQIPEEEDILRCAANSYSENLRASNIYPPRYPTRKVFCGEEMFRSLERKLCVDQVHLATQRLRSTLITSLTAFDQGRCNQSSWTGKSSPTRAEEVLQPGHEAIVLRDWVKNLFVSSVEIAQPADKQKARPQMRKRGRPKLSEDIDDFIVSSEDEVCELKEIDWSPHRSSPFIDDMKHSVLRTGAISSSQNQDQAKNTVVLSGPTGCGKTASVYAVARELGFEVFEIHPGTRRGAKEILEKVGDMTQNHLVQQQSLENSAEDSPAAPIDDASVQNEIASGKQRTMNGFFQKQHNAVSKVGRKRKSVQQDDQKKETNVKKSKKAQKQSLILLEEVDVLFEDDKCFWKGVTALINQSRRPIILTCNDESALPLEDLPLHGILRYSSPAEDTAADYLLTLAASEGHELERDAVAYVYQSQRHDLRAAITELDFWCQMGIGSRKGGLDWMPDRRCSSANPQNDGKRPRVFSKDTYRCGMGLVSQQPEMDPEQLAFDAYQQLDLPIDTWCAESDRTFSDSITIRCASVRADFYSDLNLCQQVPFDTDASDLQLRIAISLTTRLSPKPPTTSDIIDSYIKKPQQPKLTRFTLLQILEPLANEKPTFPPSQGRLAPSLDSPTSIITTDLAPYIRSIVASEQKWGAGLPVPRRNTRASAKPEGHFPKKTNAEHVLMTGGEGWQDLWARPSEDAGMDEDVDGE